LRAGDVQDGETERDGEGRQAFRKESQDPWGADTERMKQGKFESTILNEEKKRLCRPLKRKKMRGFVRCQGVGSVKCCDEAVRGGEKVSQAGATEPIQALSGRGSRGGITTGKKGGSQVPKMTRRGESGGGTPQGGNNEKNAIGEGNRVEKSYAVKTLTSKKSFRKWKETKLGRNVWKKNRKRAGWSSRETDPFGDEEHCGCFSKFRSSRGRMGDPDE